MTDSRAGRHYHGPPVLNGRVRNGNGCGHRGMVAGKSRPRGGPWVGITKGSGKGCAPARAPGRAPRGLGPEKGVNAVKRSAVSTGRLRRSPAVHVRPMYLVVFQEPLPLKGPETGSGSGFHA